MTNFVSIFFTGILSFVATNLDDLLVLMLFFSTKKQLGSVYPIVIGKYLGFTVIIVASLVGFLGGLVIPKAWIGLLGLIPLIIGVTQLFDQEKGDSDIQLTNLPSNKKIFNSTSLYVASVTIANGGDNIGIYLPLFSQANLIDLIIILTIFYILLGFWCFLAYRLVSHNIIAKLFIKKGKILTPFLLIILGVYILIKMETLSLFL